MDFFQVFLGQVDESNVCQAPLKQLCFILVRGGGGVTRAGVIKRLLKLRQFHWTMDKHS